MILLLGGCGRSEPDSSPPVTSAEASLLDAESAAGSKMAKIPFYVYKDEGVGGFVADGWMGDSGDIKMSAGDTARPQSGKTALRFDYSPNASQNARWAGVYWQFPGNPWGKKRAGYDLTGAKKITFWARGEKGGEVIQEFKVGGINGEHRDSDSAAIGPVSLTAQWKQYEIPLEGVDLSYISGGFCWSTNLELNKDGCTFYLDEIVYE
jgi:hypothetical protein